MRVIMPAMRCCKKNTDADALDELIILHDRMIDLVRNIASRKTKLERLRTDALALLRTSLQDIVNQEITAVQTMASEVVEGLETATDQDKDAAAATRAPVVEDPFDSIPEADQKARRSDTTDVFVDGIDP